MFLSAVHVFCATDPVNKHVNNITASVAQKHVQQKETSTNYLSVTDLKCNKHVNNITGSVTQSVTLR
jgi:hypothetical protein